MSNCSAPWRFSAHLGTPDRHPLLKGLFRCSDAAQARHPCPAHESIVPSFRGHPDPIQGALCSVTYRLSPWSQHLRPRWDLAVSHRSARCRQLRWAYGFPSQHVRASAIRLIADGIELAGPSQTLHPRPRTAGDTLEPHLDSDSSTPVARGQDPRWPLTPSAHED